MDRRGGPEWPDRRGPAGPWGGGRPDGPLDGLGPLPRKKKKRRTGKKRVSGSKRKLLKELKAKEAAEGKGEGEGAAPAKEGGGRGRKKKEAKKDAAAKEGDAAGSGSEEDSESSSDEEMEGAAAKPSPATLSELEVKEVPGEELRALAKDRKAEAWFYLDPQARAAAAVVLRGCCAAKHGTYGHSRLVFIHPGVVACWQPSRERADHGLRADDGLCLLAGAGRGAGAAQRGPDAQVDVVPDRLQQRGAPAGVRAVQERGALQGEAG